MVEWRLAWKAGPTEAPRSQWVLARSKSKVTSTELAGIVGGESGEVVDAERGRAERNRPGSDCRWIREMRIFLTVPSRLMVKVTSGLGACERHGRQGRWCFASSSD